MALSGFEGFEKRLELQFSGDDPVIGIGLRRLNFESLEQVLAAVQCTVVSAVGNLYFDSYVLSESSLFVYPTKIIIKTCGTTQLLKSIPPLLSHAHHLGFNVCGCRYTRGNFIFPKAQPFPHTSFREEAMYLEQSLPSNLCYRKACVMPSKLPSKYSWHVFTASDEHHCYNLISPTSVMNGTDWELLCTDLSHSTSQLCQDETLEQKKPDVFTIEVCMTELDNVLAQKFYRRQGDGNSGDVAGKEMTVLTGIGEINPGAVVCDFAFDPCGYSMNGMDGTHYSTIHVTPEDGYSYASFECVGSTKEDREDIGETLKKVVQVFRPATMSVSTTTTCVGRDVWTRVKNALESLGLSCRSCAVDEFPAAGSIVFQTFTTHRT